MTNCTSAASNSNSITTAGGSGGFASGAWSSNFILCIQCSQYYCLGSVHFCAVPPQQSMCCNCGQMYNLSTGHTCVHFNTWPTTTTVAGGFIIPAISPVLKDVKEITTDAEIDYFFDSFVTITLKLPLKFTDCFIKVGTCFVSLYPLLLSALETQDQTNFVPVFYLVKEINDKTFEGDLVVLKDVKLAKVEDNLILMQMAALTSQYFKKDEK